MIPALINPMMCSLKGAGAGGCPTSAVFLARTSGLDATHIAAYNALICGLVSDGVWAKLDVLHIYATQDTTTAQLNLVSTNYPATLHGSPTFTADRGYLGVAGSATVYIDTSFNPTTAGSPQFTQNSAHLSVWSLTSGQSANPAIGNNTGSLANNALIYTRFTDDDTIVRINSANAAGLGTNLDATGHYIGSRTAVNVITGFKNSISFISDTQGSFAPINSNMYTIGSNNNGTPRGTAQQEAMISIGSGLTQTDATNFYNRLRTYMTTVGVP